MFMNATAAGALAMGVAVVIAACGEQQQPANRAKAPGSPSPQLPATQEDRLIFTADGDITTINPDGSGRKTLLESYEVEYHPRWSPDGRRIAFARGDGAIYVMNADGTGVRRITEPRPGVEDAAWSHDGGKLVFSADTGRGFAMYLVDADGTGLERVHVARNAWLGDPDFSPDGRRIVFRVGRLGGGGTDLWTIQPDGSGLRRLTRRQDDGASPRWSPDGTRIAYGVAGRGILTITERGRLLRRIRRGPSKAQMVGPVWSPDGSRIAFTAMRPARPDDTSEIYVMDADGGGLKRVVQPVLGDSGVDW